MAKQQSQHLVSWREYERAMFNDLYYVYRPPVWEVTPNLRAVRGLISRGKREIDVSVRRSSEPRPTLVVECKRYNRPLNVKHIETFLGMLQDIGAPEGVLVSPQGWSRTAERRIRNTGIRLLQLPEREAVRLNWRELARAVFPWDEGFQPHMGNAFDAVLVDDDIDECIETLEEVPFEEWQAVVRTLWSRKPSAIHTMLYSIAALHPEDGWRYNAIQLLEEYGVMDQLHVKDLLSRETDPDTTELLCDLLARQFGGNLTNQST